MLEQARPKWIKGMMALEIVVLCMTALGPALIVIGGVVWFLDLITFGGLGVDAWSGGSQLWSAAMWVGGSLAIGGGLCVPISGVSLGLSILQYRRFRTPYSVAVIVLSSVHLGAVLLWALRMLL